MSITLLCLVKGNTLANAFPVHIDGNSLVGDLKEAIKAKNRMTLLVWTQTNGIREQELLDELTALRALHNKPVHEFDIVVSLKRKSYKWAVNIEHATLEDLKTSIREMYQPPALENDRAF
ncbi:hypothetical protein C1646_809782 [Rhizophagus diaphanus]|nr:hypothetical protein C1646_809782 [Rhizophagus diaphanus] [Rhizophagus sp. MUCL 43196]